MASTLDEAALKRLEELIYTLSPTMNEGHTVFLAKDFEEIGADVTIDHMGNMVARFDNGAEKTLALTAHADTIAVQITNILPNGYLQFRPIGPMPHVLLGQRVLIFNYKDEIVDGVIGYDPTSQYGQPKGLIFDDLWIDICVPNKKLALEHVNVGDLAVFYPQFYQPSCNEDMLIGTGLDNRVGVFILSEVARRFTELINSTEITEVPTSTPDFNLEFIFTVQEEVGLRGAQIVKAISKADSCIVVDVEYATDTLAPHNNQLSEIILSHGPVLLHKADNNRQLRDSLRDAAQKYDIPIQHGVGRYPYGGTDASQLQVGLGGMPVANIGIPCRYMHSPIETVSTKDIAYAIDLLFNYIQAKGHPKPIKHSSNNSVEDE